METPEQLTIDAESETEARLRLPIHWPLILSVSGVYEKETRIDINPPLPIPRPGPIPIPDPVPHPAPGVQTAEEVGVDPNEISLLRSLERLALDVDERYPQLVASGTITSFLRFRMHWIARLLKLGANHWSGNIFYKDGNTASFPYTTVEIWAHHILFKRSATAVFSGGGAAPRTVQLEYKSPYFHKVDFEFDCAPGIVPDLVFDTGSHSNRPATLPVENLSVQEVYRRAGFEVTNSPGGLVPLAGAGTNQQWSDAEMHDAMQTYWSHFANIAQWATWVFTAGQSEQGASLGGIMFDDIGPNHRQGTAIFYNSFISDLPPGDPQGAAFVKRMHFWTTCHEMGHAFNLAHSWQKALSSGTKGPWIPVVNEPEARSFMNYPYNVQGGSTAFFSNFEYRFTDSELLFLRHAPERFVEMGAADWFDHHGFQQAQVSPEPKFRLQIRVNRETPAFEFLEPCAMELKLTNITNEVQIVPDDIVSNLDRMTIIIKKDGKPARQYIPYAQYCRRATNQVIGPQSSVYDTVYLSSGLNGWDVAEPGYYTIQGVLRLNGEDHLSNPLRLRIAPPMDHEEEFLAQDFFSNDVGRVMAFDGTMTLEKANDTLREVVGKLSARKVATHARVALGMPRLFNYRKLNLEKITRGSESASAAGLGGALQQLKANIEESRAELDLALLKSPQKAAETLSHIDYKYYVDRLSKALAEQGNRSAAAKAQDVMYRALSARNVKASVLESVKKTQEAYETKGPKPRAAA
jgi:hypothetical protein